MGSRSACQALGQFDGHQAGRNMAACLRRALGPLMSGLLLVEESWGTSAKGMTVLASGWDGQRCTHCPLSPPPTASCPPGVLIWSPSREPGLVSRARTLR